jgi:hypothetical protein
MDLSKIDRGEFMALAGGALIIISIFMKWYASVSNLASIGPLHHAKGSVSAWQAHHLLRFLFLLGAIAPFFLAWIIVRDHQLSWPRGQMTSVISIAIVGIVFYVGVVNRPGDPSGEIELRIGWYIAVVGALLMLFGSVTRTHETEMDRKPPGVL